MYLLDLNWTVKAKQKVKVSMQKYHSKRRKFTLFLRLEIKRSTPSTIVEFWLKNFNFRKFLKLIQFSLVILPFIYIWNFSNSSFENEWIFHGAFFF